jgi:hypothetical protein
MFQPATLGRESVHYQRLNLDPSLIQPWEDGLRTDPAKRSFEWWYYDCRFDDGTRITVEFHTKPPIVPPSTPLMPFISVVLLRPDGSLVVKSRTIPSELFTASQNGCKVHMGPNFCQGDLSEHKLHVEIDDVVIDLTMVSEARSWRPKTGHWFLGQEEDRYIAWLLVMPRARVSATIKNGDRTEALSGVGYHDHNWGNVAPASIVDHWYWGHTHVGDVTLVALHAVSHAKYGKVVFPAFLLMRGGEVLAEGVEGLEFSAVDEAPESQTGVPVASRLVYGLPVGDSRYQVEFVRRRDVLALGFGEAGGYLRFVGDTRVERTRDGKTLEDIRGDGLWECLSFGPRQASGRLPATKRADSTPPTSDM